MKLRASLTFFGEASAEGRRASSQIAVRWVALEVGRVVLEVGYGPLGGEVLRRRRVSSAHVRSTTPKAHAAAA